MLYSINKFEFVGNFQERIANINAIILAKDIAKTDDNVKELERSVHPGDGDANPGVFVIGRRPNVGSKREFTVI